MSEQTLDPTITPTGERHEHGNDPVPVEASESISSFGHRLEKLIREIVNDELTKQTDLWSDGQ